MFQVSARCGSGVSLAPYWPVPHWEKEASGALVFGSEAFYPNFGLLVSPKASAQGVPGPPLLTPSPAGSSLLGSPALGHDPADKSVWFCCFLLPDINNVFPFKKQHTLINEDLENKENLRGGRVANHSVAPTQSLLAF